jgi:hypothetical protein
MSKAANKKSFVHTEQGKWGQRKKPIITAFSSLWESNTEQPLRRGLLYPKLWLVNQRFYKSKLY